MKQSKQEIIEKFREMFLMQSTDSRKIEEDEHYYDVKGFFWLERRIAYLKHWRKSTDPRTTECIKTLDDTFGTDGSQFIMFQDKIGRKKISDKEMVMMFNKKIQDYMNSLTLEQLQIFFNSFFNNYIKVTNNPEFYEYNADTGVINFSWHDIEDVEELLNCRNKIVAFSKFLMENFGIKLNLEELDSTNLKKRIDQLHMQDDERCLNKIITELSKYFSTKKQKMTKHNKKNHKKLHPFDETTEVLNYYEELSRDEDATILRILVQDETIDIENITVEQYKLALSNYDKIKDQIDDEYKINIKVALRKCQERTKYSEEQVDEIKMLEFRVGLKPKNR